MTNRPALADLQDKAFDVAIIGSGMNGASAAQQLAASGYSVLLIDKSDFCSGSSSRSGRLLHCGLRYLAPGNSIWDFARSPSKFVAASRMASQAMKARSELVNTNPERVRAYQCAFPVYQDSVYRRWQTEVAFRLLKVLGGSDIPLDYTWHKPRDVSKVPLARWLRDHDKMLGLATYREYQFDWPERIAMDMVLDSERMGATVRNYTSATRLRKDGANWQLDLHDELTGGPEATVSAKRVLNMAGIWIDQVNASAVNGAKRQILGTKGVHIMVQMPPECSGYAVHTFNREKEGYSCIPFRGMHSIGPTETVYEGDPDKIVTTDDEIDFLIDETNHIFPSLNLKREHVIYSWSGVRPLGFDPAYPKGKRAREVHDLASEGMQGVYAMTAGPIMTHRSAGREMAELIRTQITPSGEAKAPAFSRSGKEYGLAGTGARFDSLPSSAVPLLSVAAEQEHATDLIDALFRRVGLGWTPGMAHLAADEVAVQLAPVLGWNTADIAAQVARYQEHLDTIYRVNRATNIPGLAPQS